MVVTAGLGRAGLIGSPPSSWGLTPGDWASFVHQTKVGGLCCKKVLSSWKRGVVRDQRPKPHITLSLDIFCKVCLTLPGNSFTLEQPLGSEIKSHYNCLELVSGPILGAVLKPHAGFPSCTLDRRACPPIQV